MHCLTEERKLKTSDLSHLWLGVSYINEKKWDSEEGVNWLSSRSLVEPGPRPIAAWLSPVACDPQPGAFLRDFLSQRRAPGTSASVLAHKLDQSLTPMYPQGHFSCPSFESQGLDKPGVCRSLLSASAFSEGSATLQMPKSPFGAPCGVPEAAPTLGSWQVASWLVSHLRLLDQAMLAQWGSSTPAPDRRPAQWPSHAPPFRPQGNVTCSLSTATLPPCS